MMIKMLLFQILFAVIYSVECKFFDLHKDEIMVDLKYAKSCVNNNENLFKLQLLTKKYNRTHIGFDVDLNITETVDDKFEIVAEMRLWSDGGWKKNFFTHRQKDPCKTGKVLLGSLFTKVFEAINAGTNCPIEAGHYYCKDTYFDFNHVPVIIQDGRFFIFGQIIKKNRIYVCVEAEIEVKKIIS